MTSSLRSGRSKTQGTTGTRTRPSGCGRSVARTTVGPAEPVARLLLDSTVLIDALRGRAAADSLRRARRNGDEPWGCAISVEEIWRGLREEEVAAAARLFRRLRCAPLGVSEGVRAGTWRQEFASRGVTLHQADCLVASAAVGIGAVFATGNPRDFPMSEVEVAHWPVGA